MTDTTTRRGIRSLFAFLLTGMALSMMGAARPVMAAAVNNPQITLVAGQPANDAVSWAFNASFTSKNIIVLWSVDEVIQYYNAGGPEGSPVSVLVTNGYGEGAGDYGGNVSFNGYATALANKPPDASGYVWVYRLSVVIADEITFDTYASGGAVTDSEQHGAFPESGTGDPPPGGHGE